MANRIIFAGGEMDCVRILSGNPVETTTAAAFDPLYARCAIQCTTTADIIRGYFIDGNSALNNVVTGETLWFHCEQQFANDGGTTANIIQFIDTATGYPFLAYRQTSQNFVALAGNTGTGAAPVWTVLAGSNVTHNLLTKNTIDIMWTLGSPHQIAFYWNNNPLASGTFTQAAATSIGAWEGRTMTDSRASRFSQLLATVGIPTITAKVASARATGAGNSNTFAAGAFGDISEIAYSDATAMISTAAGQKYTLACSDITVPTGYTIQSVFTWARAKNGGAAPSNFKHIIRSSGVDYPSPNVAGMDIGMMPVGAQWATNPAGGGWNQVGFNQIELGGETAT